MSDLVAITDDTQPEGAETFVSPDSVEQAKWRLAIIQPALDYPRGSHKRGSLLKDIASHKYVRPDGKEEQIALRTLQEWVEKYEKHGLYGLCRRRRRDKAHARITRKWDAACPLSGEVKDAIAAEIDNYIKSVWRSAAPGCPKVQRLAQTKLLQLSIRHGWADATLEDCTISRHLAAKFEQHRLVHTHDKDAKGFFDLHRPRIMRNHAAMRPMQQVVGDVHPIDIVVTRDDGSEATPRLIGWYDVGTHRLFATVILLEKNKGVTQADVWASFADMVEEWGLPEGLYLDNGREYNGRPRRYAEGVIDRLIEGFNMLSGLVMGMRNFTAFLLGEEPDNTRSGVRRAMPYNAPGKTGIEGAFATLEKNLSMLPGHIGGNRMKKRTPKLGKKVAAWGDALEFARAFEEVLKFYHKTEQRGNMDGKSPYLALEAAQAGGWRGVQVPRETLIYAMSEERKCVVQTFGVEVNGRRYDCPKFATLRTRKIRVLVAKWAPDRIIYAPDYPSPKGMVWVNQAPIYLPTDQAGARDAAARNANLSKKIRAMKSESEELDMCAEIARDNAARPAAPTVLHGPKITLGREVDTLAGSAAQLSPPTEPIVQHLLPGEFVDKKTGEVSHVLSRPNLPPRKRRQEESDPLAAYQNPKKQGAGR